MLSSSNDAPISGERKEKFERLRQRVPRYLFRAWSNNSGGGPEKTINSTEKVVPHRFMPGKSPRAFYDVPEKELYIMVENHYCSRPIASSPFSSWASSLHLVLSYARSMPAENKPHVAAMDTEALEDDILVWHCPQLRVSGDHEYLAYGIIRGLGYKAVAFADLEASGIMSLFPELKEPPRDPDFFQFGNQLRASMFTRDPRSITNREFELSVTLAQLFDSLFLPVVLALLCLVPRSIDRPMLQKVFGVSREFGGSSDLQEIKGKQWIDGGVVEAPRFPDVKQWIDTLSKLVQYQIEVDKEAGRKATRDQNRTPRVLEIVPSNEQHALPKSAKSRKSKYKSAFMEHKHCTRYILRSMGSS